MWTWLACRCLQAAAVYGLWRAVWKSLRLSGRARAAKLIGRRLRGRSTASPQPPASRLLRRAWPWRGPMRGGPSCGRGHRTRGRWLGARPRPARERGTERVGGAEGPRLEAVAQAVLEGLEVAGRAVGAQHDLAATVVERVEGVEELLLGAGLALEELDVVEEQHVDVAESALEGLGAALAEGCQELVGERLTGRDADRQCGVVGTEQVGDRAQQVGLADARGTADEERVVGLARHLRDGQGGGVGQAGGVAGPGLPQGQRRVGQGPASGRYRGGAGERAASWRRGRWSPVASAGP